MYLFRKLRWFELCHLWNCSVIQHRALSHVKCKRSGNIIPTCMSSNADYSKHRTMPHTCQPEPMWSSFLHMLAHPCHVPIEYAFLLMVYTTKYSRAQDVLPHILCQSPTPCAKWFRVWYLLKGRREYNYITSEVYMSAIIKSAIMDLKTCVLVQTLIV